MRMFKIIQEVPFDELEDEYLDNLEWTVGYVTDEFLAQEFCKLYTDCEYEEVIHTKYLLNLKANRITDSDDAFLCKIPVKKYDGYED